MTACFVMMLSLWVWYLGDIINKRYQREWKIKGRHDLWNLRFIEGTISSYVQ